MARKKKAIIVRYEPPPPGLCWGGGTMKMPRSADTRPAGFIEL